VQHPTRSRRCARRPIIAGHAGFTLLEVLAAVLIFAVSFTALAGHSMSWVRSQGVSDRRLRATLIADLEMIDLESRLALGQAPPIDEEEKDGEEFRVTVTVEPWIPPFELGATDAADRATAGRAADDAPSLLSPRPENPDGFLRRLQVRVEWDEGIDVHSVSRTTFALDSAAANAVLDGAGLGEPPDTGLAEDAGAPQ
jgi:prepilin-type N-terminal cleavage/methylation domain-containing protein